MKRSFIVNLCFLVGTLGATFVQPSIVSAATPQDELRAFPAPTTGMVRRVLWLPKRVDEAAWRIEVRVGQEKMVDCNQQNLGGRLEEKTLGGWGYNYLQFTAGASFSTLMGCPTNTLRKAFVVADAKLLSYNSNLPVVVYLPEGYNLQYRTWRASSYWSTANTPEVGIR